MSKDVLIVLGFVIVVIMLCKCWNMIILNRFEKNKTIKNNNTLKYGTYIDSFETLELVGAGDDGNSDFEFWQAVKEIEVPNDIRIKIYD